MPNLLGVLGGVADSSLFVTTMAGVAVSVSTFGVGSSTGGLLLLFSPSVFSFFAGSLTSSVDGRFCAALLLLMIFEIVFGVVVVVVVSVGFFFSLLLLMEIFFFAVACSSRLLPGRSFLGCSLFVFKIDFFTETFASGSSFFLR